MRLGVFAKTFAGTDPAAVLRQAKAAGFETVQFNLSGAGLAPMPDAVPEGALAAIRAGADETGVTLAALSGTYNMAHPDRAVRDDGLARLAVVIEAAAALGVPLVTLCTGTRHPTDQWAHHPANDEPAAWADMAREMERALRLAEAHGVDLGIEPEQANIVRTADDALRLSGEMGSHRLRVVLDPANLFERASPDEAREIVARAVETAAPLLAMAHAKDRAADGRFATVGHGIVDFPDFLRRLRQVGFDGPLVGHGFEAGEAVAVSCFLRQAAEG